MRQTELASFTVNFRAHHKIVGLYFFSAVLQIFLSAEGCGCLAKGRKSSHFLRSIRLVPSRSSRYIYGYLQFVFCCQKRHHGVYWGSGAGANLKVGAPVRRESGGRHRFGAKRRKNFFWSCPSTFLALKVKLVVRFLVSAFVVVSTVW